MLKVENTGKFEKDFEELVLNDKVLEQLVRKRIKIFKKNSTDTRLGNHALKKKMEGKWAFSITGDIRIIYKWIGKNNVRFLAIGPHIKVYHS